MAQSLSERDREIVAAYRELGTLVKTASRFGISYERVRQILVKYERMTGETVPRTPREMCNWKPRVLWRCADCGAEMMLRPREAEIRQVCASCRADRISKRVRKRLTDELIESTIHRVLAGEKWQPIAVSAGYGESASNCLTGAVYRHLLRSGDGRTIARLWPNGVPWWLIRLHGLPPRSDGVAA